MIENMKTHRRHFLSLSLAFVLLLVAVSVGAKSPAYSDSELKQIEKTCTKEKTREDVRECLDQSLEGVEITNEDEWLLWQAALLDLNRKPLVPKPVATGPVIEETSLDTVYPVIILTVTDSREFAEFDSDQFNQIQAAYPVEYTESKFGDLIGRALDDGKRSRQRYDLYDIRLEPQRTALSIVTVALRLGLEGAGFTVVDDANDADEAAIRLHIDLVDFWFWNERTDAGFSGYGDERFYGRYRMTVKVNDSAAFSMSSRISLKGSEPKKTRSWTRTGTVLLNKLSGHISERESQIRALSSVGDMAVEPVEMGSGESQISSEIFRKAKKCQSIGGVWINDRCQIEIE